MASPFAADGKLGVDVLARLADGQEFHPGSSFIDNLGRRWYWVKAAGAIAAAAQCSIATPSFVATSGTGGYIADTAFAGAGACGWVRQTHGVAPSTTVVVTP